MPLQPVADVITLTHRLAHPGLHLQVHFESSLVHTLGPELAQSVGPVVVDHMGQFDATLGPGYADFAALMRLLAKPQFQVRVSGFDRINAQPGCAP